MKYGEALPQRSVIEWLPFNLDYNEICDLIKKHTLGRIPVSNPNLKSDFDDEIFEVLVEQLERIELFVKSKAGEIDRRISHCNKSVTSLCKSDSYNLSARRLARYTKAEAELEKAGYDIQCLSRYSKVQYTGFKKLLKKYKKWTGSNCLNDRFLPLLDTPDAFHNRDFEKNVLELSELLAAVRSKYNETIEPSRSNGFRSRISTAPQSPIREEPPRLLFQLNGAKPHAHMDADLGTDSPQNPHSANGKGGKTIYWVHTDHLVEVQVLLLKHLNLKPVTPTSTVPSTPALSRKPSATGLGISAASNWGSDKVEEVGSVLLDNLPKFAQVQSSTTIEQASDSCSAAKIHWSGNDKDTEATITVGSRTCDSGSNFNDPAPIEQLTLRLKRKYVEELIDVNTPFTLREQAEGVEKMREWFRRHPDIVPLVKVLGRRTRFALRKVCALLDRDIRMFHIGDDWEGCISDPKREDTGRSATFPHAILELRWEGADMPPLVDELNHSHLVEVVHGFSIDVHAVAVLHEPKEMAPPFWLPALSRDIRKTPTRPSRHTRSNSRNDVPQTSSSAPSVGSTVAVDAVDQTDTGLESSATIFTPQDSMSRASSKRAISWSTKNKHAHHDTWLVGERYWSEFNDENEDEPYTILIHPTPDDEDSSGLMGVVSQKLKRLFSYDEESNPERRPLISELANDTSDDDYGSMRNSPWGRKSRYGSNSQPLSFQENRSQEQSRERMLFRGYCLTFLTSIILLAATTSWVLTHNPKKRRATFNSGYAETLGVFVSAVSAGYAVSLFVARKERVSLLHRFLVFGLFAMICLIGSMVLSIIYNNWVRP